MNERFRGLPPGSNVGTQLRARRARLAREAKARLAAEAGAAAPILTARAEQLALPSAEGWFAAQGTPSSFSSKSGNT